MKQFDNVYTVLPSLEMIHRKNCLYPTNIIGVVNVLSIHTFCFISPVDDFKKIQ